MTALTEQADLFAAAAYAVAELVATIPDEAWDGPGLGEWDLRALVGHTSRALLTVETYLGKPAEREDVLSAEAYVAGAGSPTDPAAVDPAAVAQRGVAAGAALGPDPAVGFRAIVHRVLPLLDREDDPLVTTIAGGMRLSVYLQTRTFELVVHGSDIADALGVRSPEFPVEVWTAALVLAARVAATTRDRDGLLRALTGRATLPPGFSIV